MLNASFHITFHNEHILFVTRLVAARCNMPSDLNINFRTPMENFLEFKMKLTFRIHHFRVNISGKSAFGTFFTPVLYEISILKILTSVTHRVISNFHCMNHF